MCDTFTAATAPRVRIVGRWNLVCSIREFLFSIWEYKNRLHGHINVIVDPIHGVATKDFVKVTSARNDQIR